MSKKFIYSFITINLFCFFAASCTQTAMPEETAVKMNPAQISETISKADALFRQRENIERLREAVKTIAAARSSDNRNFEVELKFAKYNYFLGKALTDDKESDKAFENGKQAAQILTRLAPEKADGYFWYAANLGEQAKKSPVTVGMKSVDEIKNAMNKVIEIQPDYQNASAYDALGQLELETGMMGGSPQKAAEYLEKGISVDTNNSYLHLHLAQAYLKLNREAEARKQLDYLLKMKPNPDFVPEFNQTVAEAKKMLETKF